MTPSCSSSWTTPSTAVWPLFETWDHEMMSRSKYSNHSINRSINQFLFRSHQKRHARQAHLLQIYFRLKIQGFFLSCGGTWLEFLWGGGTKLELRYWVRIVIINQIPPGGGTENLKSRNLSRKKVSYKEYYNPRGGGTQLEFSFLKGPGHRSVRTTGRGHSTRIFLPKGARSQICQNHGAGALN